MKKYLIAVIACISIFSTQFVFAQSFPVTIATQSIPPHSGNLADMVAPGLERLGVTMILNDANELSYQVRLKVRIEGQGIVLTSKENLQLNPITLSYGVPAQLSGVELGEYFDIYSLDFSGFSREDYIQAGQLPEGFYSICITAFDYDRANEAPVSMMGCTAMNVILQDPPVILSPIGAQLSTFPQNLGVQWQERHVGGFPAAYTVQIFDYDPNINLTPDQIFEFEQPVIEKSTTITTTTIIGPSDPPLTQGGQYVMRVRANDLTMQNAFYNNGWSQPEFFTYGEPCVFPAGISATVLSETQANISWAPQPGYNTYLIRYREYGRTDANWYEDVTLNINHTLSGLADGTTYEYQVQTICNGTDPGLFSSLDTFSTPAIDFDPSEFDCTDEFTLPAPSNTTPIAELGFGDVLDLGGFEFRVTQADNNADDPDAWDGMGLTIVPWLGIKVICEFEGLYVNELKEVYDGEVTAISDAWGMLEDYVTPEEVEEEAEQEEAEGGITLCGEPYPPAEDDAGEDGGDEEAGDDDEEEEEELDDLDVDALLANLGAVFLPFALGEDPNMIVVDGMTFSPTGATMTAFMTVKVPIGDRHLAFTLTEGRFHPGGLLGNSNLQLDSDIAIELSEKIVMTIKGGENTYVSWNCEGVAAIGMEGEVAFCRDLIAPVDTDTWEVEEEGFATASFVTSMPAWGQFVADISMTPFELPDLPGWAWSVENAVFDLSDEVTPESVAFPEDYSHADVSSEAGADNPLWTGFYLGALNIKLPEGFNEGDPENPIEVAAQSIIIDYTGFSGTVSAINILPVEQGQIGSWGFSVDSLEIGIQSNQFNHAAMAGVLDISAFKQPLAYGCLIQPDDGYFFSLALTEDLEMDAWRANLTLAADTEFTLEYSTEEKSFTAGAVLHGSAGFSPSVGSDTSPEAKDKMVLPSIAFQDFELSTEYPYLINIGSWQLVNEDGEQPDMSGFPLTINEISLTQEDTEVTFLINAAVNLVGEDDSGFAAAGQVRLVSNVELNDAGRQVWSFVGVQVDELSLDVSGPGYAFAGMVNFYEDTPLYGSGFRAMIEATFEPKLEVEAVIQFGEVNGFRYWFADAYASFQPGVAIGTTGLALYGFGGGASYKMTREGLDDVEMTDDIEVDEEAAESEIGMSLSGTQYIPDRNTGIGIRARLGIGLVARETFNADLMLEIIFNANGGLSTIAFEGDARFLSPPPAPDEEEEPALRCVLAMDYDFDNDAFHAQLDIYVNAAEGMISGAYDDNLAGTGIIHADPDLWYIHLGTPDNRIMLSIDLGPASDLLASSPADVEPAGSGNQIDWGNMGLLLTAYLDAGMNLPPFPDLPPEVTDILGDIAPMNPSDPRFASGSGLMFGASVQLSIPDISFLAFYAEFSAGAGYDMMIVNLGEDARCAGNENSSEPIGINGWYAMGQVWAYVEGAIGLKVDIFSVKGKFEILSIAAAAVLQAKLPNPMWMKGIVGGRYSILGGLVSGNCRFEFELGEKCDIVGADPLAGIKLIGSTQPNLNTNEEVDVFVRPQVTFNLPVGEIFELKDDEGNTTQYRAIVDNFYIKDLAAQVEIEGAYVWNDLNDVVAFTPADILTGYADYELSIKVQFESRPEGTTAWSLLLDEDNNPYEQSELVPFTTGGAPDHIPYHNVAYSYPVIDQFNFLTAESNQGYIQLKQGQPYLFESESNFALDRTEWTQKLAFYQNGAEITQSGFSYSSSTKRVSYNIPGSQMAKNNVTRLALVNVPTVANSGIDDNVEELEEELLAYQNDDSDAEFTTIIVEAKVAEGTIANLKEKDFFSSHFRTSLHNTFAQKMAALDISTNWFDPIFLAPGESALTINRFGVNTVGDEYFDVFDQEGYFNGHEDVPPLVQPVANLNITGGNWYNNTIGPNMYAHFPIAEEVEVGWRDTEILGIIPTRAISLTQNATPHKLSEEEKTNGGTTNIPLPFSGIAYNLPYTMLRDYFDYQQAAADYIVTHNNVPTSITNFNSWQFIYPEFGDYGVRLEYVLPGNTTPNSVENIIIPYGTNN